MTDCRNLVVLSNVRDAVYHTIMAPKNGAFSIHESRVKLGHDRVSNKIVCSMYWWSTDVAILTRIFDVKPPSLQNVRQ